MAEVERNVKMTVRLSEDEEAIRDWLEIRLGTDGNSVMRQGMMDLAEAKGLKLPQRQLKQKNSPSHRPGP